MPPLLPLVPPQVLLLYLQELSLSAHQQLPEQQSVGLGSLLEERLLPHLKAERLRDCIEKSDQWQMMNL